MNHDIARKYQKTYDDWYTGKSLRLRRNGEPRKSAMPLSFAIPAHVKPSFNYLWRFQLKFLTPTRMYNGRGNYDSDSWSDAWIMASIVAFLGLACIIFNLLSYQAPALWQLLLFGIPLVLAGISYWKYRRWQRYEGDQVQLGFDIFDRETGKVYLFQGKGKPHLAVDFYEQHFIVKTSQFDPGTANYTLPTLEMYARERLPNGEFKTHRPSFPMAVSFGYNTDKVMQAWYGLLRYMDKSTVFTAEELAMMDKLKAEKAKQGYKIEGIRWPDGTVEWV